LRNHYVVVPIVVLIILVTFAGFTSVFGLSEEQYQVYNGKQVSKEDYDAFTAQKDVFVSASKDSPTLYSNHATLKTQLSSYDRNSFVSHVPEMSKEHCNQHSKCWTVYNVSHPFGVDFYPYGFASVFFINSKGVFNDKVTIGIPETVDLSTNESETVIINRISWSSLETAKVPSGKDYYYVKVSGSLKENQDIDNVLDLGNVYTYWEYVPWEFSDNTQIFWSFDSSNRTATTINDLSNEGTAYDGTISGSPIFSPTNAIVGDAAHSDTDSDYWSSSIYGNAFDESGDFNILFSMNLNSIPVTSPCFFGKGFETTTGRPYMYLLFTSSNNTFYTHSGVKSVSGASERFGNDIIRANTDYFVSYEYTQSSDRVALRVNTNGTGWAYWFGKSSWGGGNFVQSGYNFSVGGCSIDNPPHRLDGSMDNFGVLDKVLNETELDVYFSKNYPFPVDESDGRDAIESGIVESLNSYTIYTDQQVYTRHLNGSQQQGTFDKVVVSGKKQWAFNYIYGSDTYINMWNMTPAFYVLEMSNLTPNKISKLVSDLISSTE